MGLKSKDHPPAKSIDEGLKTGSPIKAFEPPSVEPLGADEHLKLEGHKAVSSYNWVVDDGNPTPTILVPGKFLARRSGPTPTPLSPIQIAESEPALLMTCHVASSILLTNRFTPAVEESRIPPHSRETGESRQVGRQAILRRPRRAPASVIPTRTSHSSHES